MESSVPYFNELLDCKRSLLAHDPRVREKSLRQSSDFAFRVYQAWKDDLDGAGVSWPAFAGAMARNRDAWRSWLNGEMTWRAALEQLVERLNTDAGSSLTLVG